MPIQPQHDIEILTLALKKTYEAMDLFIDDCLDNQAKPKAPSVKSLMRIRACLPKPYRWTLK